MKKLDEIIIPDDRLYAAQHEWVSRSAPFRVGISDFAQDQLGDITYAELPEKGDAFRAGAEFGSLESIKSVSPLYLPLDGRIAAVNARLADDPGLINRDPYGEGWLVEIVPDAPGQNPGLLDASAYRRHLEEQA